MKYNLWVLAGLCAWTTAYANTPNPCGPNNPQCDLQFIEIPEIPVLSVGDCLTQTITEETYVIRNNTPIINAITQLEIKNNDGLADDLVSLNEDAPNACTLDGTLPPHYTCSVTLSFNPCVAGNLDRTLEIKGETTQGTISSDIQTDITPACVTIGVADILAPEENDTLPFSNTTFDFGRTWQNPTFSPAKNDYYNMDGISCVNTGVCVAVGNSNTDVASFTSLDWGSSWLPLTPTSQPVMGSVLNDVSCVITGECVAVGNYYKNLTSNVLYTSDDFGRTWEPANYLFADDFLYSELTGVSCLPNGFCMTVGLAQNLDIVPVAQSYTSTDFGHTWTNTTPTHITNLSELIDISCTPNGHCVAVGETYSEDEEETGFIVSLATTDFGQNWSSATVIAPTTSDYDVITRSLGNISCVDNGHCLAVGTLLTLDCPDRICNFSEVPLSYTSANFGKTWKEVSPPPPADVTVAVIVSSDCVNDGHCVAIGAFGPDSNVYPLSYTTLDFGNTWEMITDTSLPPSLNTDLTAVNDISCGR